jgi:hypothetical protein
MNEAELRRFQQDAAATFLFSLHERCRRRFTNAARLVGADLAQWPSLTVIGAREPVDLSPLLPFWDTVRDRYMSEMFDSQMQLFGRAEPQCDQFSQFIHWRLWPRMASEDECVRNVLRVTGSLPSRDPQGASYALITYIAELPFHLTMQPLDAED